MLTNIERFCRTKSIGYNGTVSIESSEFEFEQAKAALSY